MPPRNSDRMMLPISASTKRPDKRAMPAKTGSPDAAASDGLRAVECDRLLHGLAIPSLACQREGAVTPVPCRCASRSEPGVQGSPPVTAGAGIRIMPFRDGFPAAFPLEASRRRVPVGVAPARVGLDLTRRISHGSRHDLPRCADRVLHAGRQRDIEQVRWRCRCRGQSPNRRTFSPRRSVSRPSGRLATGRMWRIDGPACGARLVVQVDGEILHLRPVSAGRRGLEEAMVGATKFPAALRIITVVRLFWAA